MTWKSVWKSVLLVGSSPESVDFAYSVQDILEPGEALVTVWPQGDLQSGTYGLEDLISTTQSHSFAVILFAPQDPAIVQTKNRNTIRENVVLELGLITASIGRDRTVILAPAGADLHLAGDLRGWSIVFYESGAAHSHSATAAAEASRTMRWVMRRLDELPPGSTLATVSTLREPIEKLPAFERVDLRARKVKVRRAGPNVNRNARGSREPSVKLVLDRSEVRWDVFISHATEDKDEVARPLARELMNRGVRVWFDEFTLRVGDDLRDSIDLGLSNSLFGIVILSRHFFSKNWTAAELNALANKEQNGEMVVLPVWHKVRSKQVRDYSALLAAKIAVSTRLGIKHVADKLMEAMHFE